METTDDAVYYPKPSTPFPNVLLDEIMPTLRDTEWRLLCVIVRATLGWQDGNPHRRKRRDWLTQRQMMKRTGRNTAALSKALDALVRRALVEVTDADGRPLLSGEERRRSRTRLYYRLNPRLLLPASAQSELPTSQSEVRKANTTKETDIQKTPKGGADVVTFLNEYRDRWRRRCPTGEPPQMNWARDGRIAKQLLAAYPLSRLVELLDLYFDMPDPWIRRRGPSLTGFRIRLGALMMGEAKGDVSRSGGWVAASNARRCL
jgi:hypothetical protein